MSKKKQGKQGKKEQKARDLVFGDDYHTVVSARSHDAQCDRNWYDLDIVQGRGIHIGKFIRSQMLEPAKMSVRDTAFRLRMRKQDLSAVLKRKAPLTDEIIGKLCAEFGYSASRLRGYMAHDKKMPLAGPEHAALEV